MIRDRLKKVARKAAIKLFNMEFDIEEQEGVQRMAPKATPTEIDESLIPKVVDGSGDTPGPNHKSEIGRPHLAAQVVAGAAPFFVDIRPAAEVAGGFLPGALFMPGQQIKQNLGRLPDKETRITVYDQTGLLGSFELAGWLREQGWGMARSLRGGFAEWVEHSEPIHQPSLVPGARYRVSDPVKLKDGRTGHVQEVTTTTSGVNYNVCLPDNTATGPVGEDALLG